VTDHFPDASPQTTAPTIRADLNPRRHAWAKWVATATALLLLSLLGAAFGWRAFLSDLPKVPVREALWAEGRSPGMSFLDRNGEPIATRGPRHGEKVTLKDLPPHVAHAFLAAEDHRFYQHGPVDPVGILRAARANWQAGEVVQGGSTLTQQLAKTIWLNPDQTFKRKVQEAILATRLERVLSKDEVLELYLNRIFFGSNAYGIDAAARVYFRKSAKALNLSEAALLAALPKAPSRLRPTRDMAGAVQGSPGPPLTRRRRARRSWRRRARAKASSATRWISPPSRPRPWRARMRQTWWCGSPSTQGCRGPPPTSCAG
jgi:penicillin-binding protein 1A